MIIEKDFDISQVSYIKVGGIVKKYIEVDNVSDLYNVTEDFIPISNTSKILFAFDYLDKTILKFTKSK